MPVFFKTISANRPIASSLFLSSRLRMAGTSLFALSLTAASIATPEMAWAASGGQGILGTSGAGGAGGVDGDAASAEGKLLSTGHSNIGGGGGATNLTNGRGGAGGGQGGTAFTPNVPGGTGTDGDDTGLSLVNRSYVGSNGEDGPNPSVGIAGGGGGGGGVGVRTTLDLIVTENGSVTGGSGGIGGTSSGGGGGGVGIFTSADVTIDATGTVNGGAGGGLYGTNSQAGAGGGAAALLVTGGGTVANNGTLTGGMGGGTANIFLNLAGAGGGGGEGVLLTNGGVVINWTGATITGGDGGKNGTGLASRRIAASVGGAGIKGAGLTVVNAGKITGGMDGSLGNVAATTRANAIAFTGGINSLELWSSSVITGNVQAFSIADNFTLGGAADGNFNASLIGDSAQYRGFGTFEKTGDSTWSLTGTTTARTPWTLTRGTLSIAHDASLGDGASGLIFNGGTLQTTTGFTTNRDIALNISGGNIETSPATTLIADGVFSGIGGLIKRGTGTLTLTNANTYQGDTRIQAGTLSLAGIGSIEGSSQVVADGTFDISGTTDGVSIKRLAGSGTIAFGNQAMTLTQANDTFSGQFTGTGVFVFAGGHQTLTGDSSAFTGLATVQAGTLSVNGILGGAMDVRGGRLQGIGQLGTTSNYAGGVIAPGNSIGTLTIAGDYVSNGGGLEIEAILGDDSSPSDLLAIIGNSTLGTGPTRVNVTNIGGAGAETTGDGIRIVQVGGVSDADAFVLGGLTIGGAYRYELFQNGIADPTDGDWYLRSAGLAPTVPVYQNYPQILLGMVELPTLQQRIGNRHWAAMTGAEAAAGDAQSAIWTRIEGAHGRFKAKAGDARFDRDTALVQLGLDGQLAASASGMLVGGITAQYGRASADIFSTIGEGANTTTSYGIGATLTWYGENGFYVDGQAQLTTMRSDLSAAGIGSIGNGIHGSGYALSLEAGRKTALGGGWSLTPQAQLAYSSVDFDRFTDPFGAVVSLKKGDSLKGRLGVSADYQPDAGKHVYGIANLTYEFLDGTAVAVSNVDLAFTPQRFGAELGLGGAYSWGGGKYALYGEALAATSFQGSRSLKGTVGLTVGF